MDIVPVKYTVASQIEYIIYSISERAKAKNLELVFNIDEKLPSELFGDDTRINQIIMNLLTNAVQAIDNQQKEDAESGKASKKGQVQVSLRNSSRDGFIDIVFEDNGPGVNDENRGRLFTPNFTTKSSGTGLGLAICKNILERCGGDIAYSRSFTLGGACFTVRFPKR